MLVSVLTPSIPERAGWLEECKASVAAQTFEKVEHLVEVDHDHAGCSVTMNKVAARSSGEWLLPLADDDLLHPDCVEALVAASADADVVYAPPEVWGRHERAFHGRPPEIPSCALIRTKLWYDLGGYDETVIREEDRRMWTAALAHGARFVRVAMPTWVYRHHAGNKSFNNGVAA